VRELSWVRRSKAIGWARADERAIKKIGMKKNMTKTNESRSSGENNWEYLKKGKTLNRLKIASKNPKDRDEKNLKTAEMLQKKKKGEE